MLENKRQARYQVFKKEKAKYKRHIKQAMDIGWRKICSAASHRYAKQYKTVFTEISFLITNPIRDKRRPKEKRKRSASVLLISFYFTPACNKEGAGEIYDSETDISSGVHKQPEKLTTWRQRKQVCGYSHQRANKQNSNSKKR
ncbi:hypothetical protein AVEN_199832-1 [Araneus ventricosus]|uniref:Uncharacterized protein n=1 Tax=Araneus ventricosus TaxID=182803 RepID=A0A4Y2DVH5_ARAVE|nr:hypothetical protein AVEN_199832-1 [Araneus ventricosus]